MIAKIKQDFKGKVKAIETTTDKLTGRGGLTFVSRYLENQSWLLEDLRQFDVIKGHRKGTAVHSMLLQMILFFIDGTSLHLNQFDALKKQEEYGDLIGVDQNKLVSTSAIKRMLNKIGNLNRSRSFRKLYDRFIAWRFAVEQPPYIILDVDTMVLDNNDAQCREGVNWTYKKVNGFQPLMAKWNGYVVSAKFREGKAHSNHGTDTAEMLRHSVSLIRKHCRKNVPIVVTMDSGFYDQKLMSLCEDELEIGYIIGGKVYKDIVERVMQIPEDEYGIYQKPSSGAEWYYTEFEDQRPSWEKARRAIFTGVYSDGDQMLIKHTSESKIVYTNLGENNLITAELDDAGCGYLADTEKIIMLSHNRGDSELTHRHIKDFGAEQMPCKYFKMNEVFFHMMIFSFNLHQAFKRDCLETVIGKDTYAKTLRRKFLDFAGKIVSHGGKVVMKVTASVKKTLQLDFVWEKAAVQI